MPVNRTETDKKIKNLKTVLVLVASYLVVEVVASYYTGSLALLADAGHMFTDTFGIGLALFATIYSKRAATSAHTFGFYRTEILASLVNSVILLLMSAFILYEAYRRIFEPPEIQSIPMLIVATAGLIVNLVGIFFLRGEHSHNHDHRHHHNTPSSGNSVSEGNDDDDNYESDHKVEDLNIQGAKLELLSDTIGSVAVIAAGIIISLTNLWIADPIISIGLAIFIVPRTWSLMKKSVRILMEGAPLHLPYEEIKKAMLNVRGVTGVFDLHIWSITSGIHALSAHVVVIDLSKSDRILKEINSILEKRFGITHSTIQIEGYHSVNDI